MIKNTWEKNENASANKKEITVLKEHFPACFKEDGSFDIERFKEYLSEDINVVNEGYELKFLGKNYARLLVTLETETVIVPNEEHNQKEENKDSENIYITGDNLDGLKHLLKSYAGKVKCIYIDPPYNTGSDGFVYNDNFNFTVEELTEKLSIGEEQAQRILDLTKRGSAAHSAWLMFMYPRLQLARDLLSDDGVIFISVDDNEQANLKLLCDDVFGEENFVASIIWEKVHTRKNSAKYFSVSHDYILCFSKKKENFDRNLIPREDTSAYTNPDNDPKGPWKADPIYANNPYDADYLIEKPNGIKLARPAGRFWRYSEETIKKAIDNNQILWGEGDSYPMLKRYLSEVANGLVPITIFDRGFAGDNMEGNSELKELFGYEKVFSYPKPTNLIKRLVQIGSSDGDIILDFFSGSGTTAHSLYLMNSEIEGNRRFITIQLPEKTEKNTVAFNRGYKTLDQVGRDRIIKAANKIQKENPRTSVDLGFKHYTLMDPKKETLNKLASFNPDENKLFADKTLLDEFGVPTVITTWLNNDGYGLTTEAEKILFADYEAYYKGKHLYLVHPELPNEAIEELVVKYETDGNFNPENIVLFGYSFTWTELESLKTNLKRLQDTEKNLRINFDVRY